MQIKTSSNFLLHLMKKFVNCIMKDDYIKSVSSNNMMFCMHLKFHIKTDCLVDISEDLSDFCRLSGLWSEVETQTIIMIPSTVRFSVPAKMFWAFLHPGCINGTITFLLPWRKKKKKKHNSQFFSIIRTFTLKHVLTCIDQMSSGLCHLFLEELRV